MVVIRLARSGAKKSPFYHIVVTDRRNPRDGSYIEELGYFNPMARGKATRLELNQEQINHWLEKGAQPSGRVAYLIKEYQEIKLNPEAAAKRIQKKADAKAKKQQKAQAAAAASTEAATTEAENEQNA